MRKGLIACLILLLALPAWARAMMKKREHGHMVTMILIVKKKQQKI